VRGANVAWQPNAPLGAIIAGPLMGLVLALNYNIRLRNASLFFGFDGVSFCTTYSNFLANLIKKTHVIKLLDYQMPFTEKTETRGKKREICMQVEERVAPPSGIG